MRLSFFGATGTVTGSRYLLSRQDKGQLLVDCGMFQGLKQLRLRNWDSLPFDAAQVDAVLLTHAHVDHSGFLPRLVKEGFKGRVYCTPSTLALCKILLPDAGRLQEEQAEFENRHKLSKHAQALPLYTEEDAWAALKQMHPVAFDDAFSPLEGWSATFRYAGHILGAASVKVSSGGQSVLFSGDLGRSDDLVMKPPASPDDADVLVIESTYGDRLHPEGDPLTQLAEVISRTAARGGQVVIPSFAVGRAQTLLHCIAQLKQARRIPDLPVYLNSPMAVDATRLYSHHADEHRLSPQECIELGHVAKFANSVDESKALNRLHWPSVIVSASGMATGGRVLHHLQAYAPDPRCAIVFAGFQAAGTRGAALVAGARTIKVFGEYVPVRAAVANLDMLSAHADRDDLLNWMGSMRKAPRRVFVTHGEPVAADALRLAIQDRFGWPCQVPEYRDCFTL